MKFETINGTLCIMTEPKPLTPDAKFPCVVRLIQDDSPMGICNRWKYSEKQDFLKKYWTIASLENNLNKAKDIHYSQFEVLGYPVVDGSAEWRNYQLMQGKCVYHPGDSEYYQVSGQGRIIGKLIENNEFNSTWNRDTFMRDDSDGWQIYHEPKPKPLLADAKVGWLCERRDGTFVQIDAIRNNGNKWSIYEAGGHSYHESGNSVCSELYHTSFDIISTEPLAPEGSAEWAWQMMLLEKKVTYNKMTDCYWLMVNGESEYRRDNNSQTNVYRRNKEQFLKAFGKTTSGWQLYEQKEEAIKEPESPIDPVELPLRKLILQAEEEGKNIRTYYQDMVFTPNALATLLAEGRFRWWNICNWELTDREQNYYPQIKLEPESEPEHCPACNGTGVVMHETPNDATQTDLPASDATQPKYEVGDWVEYFGDQRKLVGIPIGEPKPDIKYWFAEDNKGYETRIYTDNITRKLSPSEVKVKITLEGTVRSSINDSCFELSTPNGGWATIGYNEIDPATAYLVRELIKKQEEK